MNKQTPLLITCMFLLFSLCLKGHNDEHNDYGKLIITPSLGISLGNLFYEVKSASTTIRMGYILGGMIEIRPIRQVGFAAGLASNGWIIGNDKNNVAFYTVPLVLNFYSQDGFVVTGGPIFILNAEDDNLMDTSPVKGFMIGLRDNRFEISYRYLSSKFFTNDDGGIISRIIGMGLYFEIGLKVPISRDPIKPVISFRFS